jgi:sugar lactone lactonase YvrE
MQAVPTAVAVGPDGDLYVGQLTGFPFPPGGANVYRVHDGVVTVYKSGFTNIVDMAFDKSGALYVLEISKAGLLFNRIGGLFRIEPNAGPVTEIKVENPLTHENLLNAPGGIAIGKDGTLYITINSTLPQTGTVLRVEP